MAQLPSFAHDSTNVPLMSEFEVLPAGWFTGMITESEMKKTKNEQGEYLELVIEVTKGEKQGSKIWRRLNLLNPNEKAVEMAVRELSSIKHAVNRLRIKDSEELHGIPFEFLVKVVTEKKDETGKRVPCDPFNEIGQYRPVQSQATTAKTTKAKTESAPVEYPAIEPAKEERKPFPWEKK